MTKLSLRDDIKEQWKDVDWERLRPHGSVIHEISVGGNVSNPQAFIDFLGAFSTSAYTWVW